MKPLKVFLFIFLLSINNIKGQLENSQWYFGGYAGLSFLTTPPTILTNSAMDMLEGVASISDATGNILFYTNGINVYNSAHTLMANGSGLNGNPSSAQSGIIVKQPGNGNIYYIFTVTANQACYSIVDMNLAAGMGSVTVKNASLYMGSSERQVAIRHCNGRDVWIVNHEVGTSNFRTYLLTANGLNLTPIITPIGDVHTGNNFVTIGHLKISPNGHKLAMTTASNSIPTSLGLGGVQLFDFDPATGVISNSLSINAVSLAWGVEFSPDGSKLYCTKVNGAPTPTHVLYQWDICQSNTAAIIASQYSVVVTATLGIGSIQRAIDGKLYFTPGNYPSLNVINNPNASGAAINLQVFAQTTGTSVSKLGLPNFINEYTRPVPTAFNSTVACQELKVAPPATPIYTVGCSPVSYPPASYLWDFGDPGSGTSNTATAANSNHIYTALGTYTVSLTMYGNCTNDTIKQVINISTPGPSISVSGTTEICKGDKRVYTASGGTSYLWSNNATTSSVSLSPSTTTVYSVKGTSGGCNGTKVFTITVNPCTGINEGFKDEQGKFYPNPFKEVLNVEAKENGTLLVFDLTGKQVLRNEISAGSNEVNTSLLPNGIYIYKLESKQGTSRGKIVKGE